MKIFLISPVRAKVSKKEQRAIEDYVASLEKEGHQVWWPIRDTDQIDGVGLRICNENLEAIKSADQVHFWWHSKTQGGIFDFGMNHALGKKIVVANLDRLKPPSSGKSFLKVLLVKHFDNDRLALVRFLRKFSNCPKNQTAAVLYKDDNILSFGWNMCGPEGIGHGKKVINCPRIGLPSGVNPELCHSVCAEKTALLNIRSERNPKDYADSEQHIVPRPELIKELFAQEELNCFAGAKLIVTGHYWVHPNCELFAKLCGIKEIIIDQATAQAIKK